MNQFVLIVPCFIIIIIIITTLLDKVFTSSKHFCL